MRSTPLLLELPAGWKEWPLGQIAATVVVVGLLVLIRYLVLRGIRRAEAIAPELRRRWMVTTRNVALLVLVLSLFVIWASELRVLAVSIVAIVAAIVIATKELIMCVSGTVLKTSGRSFSIGDRIEIQHLRGDVIDQTLLTTTILEIGPGDKTHQHTGRAITLPNSLFLTNPVTNESFTDEYVLHVFVVPMKAGDDWETAQDLLLDCATSVCQPFLTEARMHMERLAKDQGLYTPSVDPRVTIQLPEPDKVLLVVRIPVPARRKGRVEQEILRRYLSRRAAK